MKRYAVSIDISPSEQLNSNDEIKVMSLLFGLKSPYSFDFVGSNAPNKDKALTLRKWSNAPQKYKEELVKHLSYLKSTGNIAIGVNISNDKFIRESGTKILESFFGRSPNVTSYSKKGKPRVSIRIYDFKDLPYYDFELLFDEMLILGWYTHNILLIHDYLVDLNKQKVKLDVVIDKLPLDIETRKAGILALMCDKLSNGLIDITGVVLESDKFQRDLLSDNIAGLQREIVAKKDSNLYGFNNDTFGLVWNNVK